MPRLPCINSKINEYLVKILMFQIINEETKEGDCFTILQFNM